MIISPELYFKSFEHAGLDELILERKRIFEEIRRYEEGKIVENTIPSKEVLYQLHNKMLILFTEKILEYTKNEEMKGHDKVQVL